ncbi:MAG TPA: LCP family protein [Stackebrandtia sp.]|jgi:anionic cell wall polymer biosynthesis LytR-Cps2A-Psr (LCP) family protein|uniref:LCP family protein n=1 Tax=Stackebrandtia sp. TaxID=2023065 RepID=UPI002D24AC50|nr:LCP family protein [Stackebrandtia sp.]HZE39778.1 LCP family protein [Stackebrandtia sp.]
MSTHGKRRVMSKAASPLWAKFLVGIGAVLLVASLATGGYAKIMIDKVNDSVGTDDLVDNNGSGDIKGPLNMLMIGSDKRKSWSSAQSDSIMILHINKALTKATIVSIPRDLKVDIQDCGSMMSSPCNTKINASFTAGGSNVKKAVRNLAQTVSDLTAPKDANGKATGKGISFDGAAMVNFQGFYKVVKTLGSIELCLPMKMTPAHADGKTFPKGCHEYGYKDALGIVRERYAYDPTNPDFPVSWGIGDYGRQHMQQHFIKQLFKKAEEEGYVSNPSRVGTLIKAVGDNILVDLGGHTVTDFAFALRHVKPSSMKTVKVPSEPADIEGTSYVVIQPGEEQTDADDLFKALREDKLDDWITSHPDWVNSDK